MNSRILGTRFREGAKILVVYENVHPSKPYIHHPSGHRVVTSNKNERIQQLFDRPLLYSLESNCKASAACKPQPTASDIS